MRQLMNASVIQSIGSLSRQMKAKILLVDATTSPKMLLRKSLLQQATPLMFSSDFRVLGNRLATTRVPRSLSDSKDVPGKQWAKARAACDAAKNGVAHQALPLFTGVQRSSLAHARGDVTTVQV